MLGSKNLNDFFSVLTRGVKLVFFQKLYTFENIFEYILNYFVFKNNLPVDFSCDLISFEHAAVRCMCKEVTCPSCLLTALQMD